MSIATWFASLFASVESEAPVLAAAYDQIDGLAGFFLGAAEAVVVGADPALTPIVTPLMTELTAARAAAKSAVDALAVSAVADSQAANTAIAGLVASVAAMQAAAGPGVTVIANALMSASTAPAA